MSTREDMAYDGAKEREYEARKAAGEDDGDRFKVLFVCTVCGAGFPGYAEEGSLGQMVDRTCYTQTCLRTQPHYVVESPNWNRLEVVLPQEIPQPQGYWRDTAGKSE